MLCKQAVEMLSLYSWESMKGIGGRKSFSGSLALADKVTAKRCADVKDEKKKARSKPNDLTPAEREAALIEAFSTPLAVQKAHATILAITQGQRVFAVVMEEKISGQVNGEASFWSKTKGGTKGILSELRKVLPLIFTILVRTGGVKSLASKSVTIVRTNGPRKLLCDRQWVEDAGHQWCGPKVLNVHVNAQAQHGLVCKINSLVRFFFARENPWKPCSGAVEGEVPVNRGSIQRGSVCPYCHRDGRNLQHWGCVACFLGVKSRKILGVCILMNTFAPSLVRQRSEAAKVASTREGRTWE